MNPPTCQELLCLSHIVNSIMGLPVFTFIDDKRGMQVILFTVYEYITEAIVLVTTVGEVWAIPHSMHDMNLLVNCLSVAFHTLQCVLTTVLFIQRRQHTREHVASINKMLLRVTLLEKKISIKSREVPFRDFVRKDVRAMNKIFIALLIVTIFSTNLYFLPFVVSSIINRENLEGQTTAVIFYFPWDFMYTPALQIVNVFIAIALLVNNLKTVAMQSFLLALIYLHAAQFRYLRMLLDTILTVKIEKAWNKTLLKEWIVHHQMQLRLSEDLKELMSQYVFIPFGYIFTVTCCSIFCITSTSDWTALQKAFVFFVLICDLFLLFFVARAGDFLTDSVQDTAVSLYNEDLTRVYEKWKFNVFQLTSMKSLKPFNLKFASIFPLNCATFFSLCKLITSYYLSLLEIQKIKKGPRQ